MAQIKENIKAPRHWPLWGKSTGDRWIPRTKDHNAENGSIWWRNHVHVIPILLQELQLKVFHPIQKTCNKTICYIWHNGQPYCSCIPIMGLWSSSWNATERWPLRTEGSLTIPTFDPAQTICASVKRFIIGLACRSFGAKKLLEPALNYCQLDC